ncbi:MAG: hypothetical protein PWP23_911 [Candidatus Sumerlaeota bacterium]|nr:hypothetical protein [Candidatus Sumerlaeota bacterium]
MPSSAKRNFTKRTIVHLAEGYCTPRGAKTTRGVLVYSEHDSVAVIDSTNAGKTARQLLDGGGDIPVVGSLADVFRMGLKPDTLVVGVTPVGGRLPTSFRRPVIEALEAGIDVWSGMHQFLQNDQELRLAAERGGAEIWDVRKPPEDLPVGMGAMINNKSYSMLMVGTDCALGKMTAGLVIRDAAKAIGKHYEFVATGQTGMMITGWGHPVDAIPGDFMCGCVEKDCLSVDGQCDAIIVEGQGSLLHPGYSPVTLGLLHGCMPDGMILCHQPSRTAVSNREHVLIPALSIVAKLYEDVQKLLKPSRVIGGVLNTHGMAEDTARAAIEAAENDLGRPVTDPVRFGAEVLVEAIEKHRKEIGK